MRTLIIAAIKRLFLRSSKYHYDQFYGGTRSIFLYFVSRVFVAYSRKRHLINALYSNKCPKILFRGNNIEITKLSESEQGYVDEIRRNGFVKIKENFSDLADIVLEDYAYFFRDTIARKNNYYSLSHNYDVTQDLLKISLNPICLKVLCLYNNLQIYLRACPHLSITYPHRGDIPSKYRGSHDKEHIGHFSDTWHLDTVQNIQFHMLLSDITDADPHMLYAKRSHLYKPKNYIASEASDEFITDNFEIIRGTGKKGDIYIFDGSNGWHRLMPAYGDPRLALHVLFTNGANMLSKTSPIRNFENMVLDELTREQIKTLKHFE